MSKQQCSSCFSSSTHKTKQTGVYGCCGLLVAGAHLQEKVTLKFKDAAGVQHEAQTLLCSRRLHKDTLNLYLGAQRLVLVEINGEVPGYDQNGLTLQAFEPGQVIELTTEVSPGEMAVSMLLLQSTLDIVT